MRSRPRRAVVLLLSLTTLVTAPWWSRPQAESGRAAEPAVVAPPATADPDEVLATYRGGVITRQDAMDQLTSMPPRTRSFIGTLPRKRQFIEGMVLNEMIYAEGKKLGLDRSEEVKRRIALMRRQLKSLRRKFVIDSLLARYRGLEITDAQLRAQYDDNPGMYSDARIRVRQIKAADPESAEAILAEVRAHPERFADVARERSLDAATAKEGGDLGVIVEGTRPLSFERVAFALQPGEISDVVATHTGLYIIMVTERAAGQRKPFESVQETIRGQLATYMQFEGYAAKVAELKARAAMQLNDEAIARLNTVEGLPKGWRKQLRETAATP